VHTAASLPARRERDMANSSPLRSARPVYPIGPAFVLLSCWNRRELVRGLVVRDVMGRYRGSLFGVLWALVQPLILLAIYTLVFSEILPTRWPHAAGTAQFALHFFIGLILFNFFAECLNRSPALVLGNPNFVKKVRFPVEVLAWMAVGSALFQLAVSFAAWMAFQLAIEGFLPWTVVWMPLILLPIVLWTLGLSWILASLGVFVRDAGQAVGLLTTGLLFLSPVFYEASAVPQRWRWILALDPLTFPIEQARRALFDGQSPDPLALAAQGLVGFAAAWLGLVWFQRTRSGFADVL